LCRFGVGMGRAVAGVLIVLGGGSRRLVGGFGALFGRLQGLLGRGKGRFGLGDSLGCIGRFRRGGAQGVQGVLGAVPRVARFGIRLLAGLPGGFALGIGAVKLLLGLLQRKVVGGFGVAQLGDGG